MIVVDTHIWVWWTLEPSRLSTGQRQRLDETDEAIGLCSVSCREIAAAVARGRLTLDADLLEWLRETIELPRVVLLDLTPAIAVESVNLPESFHRDPFDQIIVATARIHGCPLMTADHKILDYQHVDTIA